MFSRWILSIKRYQIFRVLKIICLERNKKPLKGVDKSKYFISGQWRGLLLAHPQRNNSARSSEPGRGWHPGTRDSVTSGPGAGGHISAFDCALLNLFLRVLVTSRPGSGVTRYKFVSESITSRFVVIKFGFRKEARKWFLIVLVLNSDSLRQNMHHHEFVGSPWNP